MQSTDAQGTDRYKKTAESVLRSGQRSRRKNEKLRGEYFKKNQQCHVLLRSK